MTDSPYEVGFLEDIINVHFGGEWFGVQLIMNGSIIASNSDFEVDFPSIAGGTPGVFPALHGVFAPYVSPTPHSIAAADLSRKLRTNAGAPIVGFGAAIPVSGGSTDCRMYFSTASFARAPFNINVTTVNHLGGGGHVSRILRAFTVAKGAMKTGLTLTDLLPGNGVPEASSVQTTLSFFDTFTASFRVDPDALTVTGPF